MKTVLIFEPKVTGHYLKYVAALIPACLKQGIRVTLALNSSAKDAASFEETLSEFQSDVEIFFVLPVARYNNDLLNACVWSRSLLALLKSHRFDAVFVPGGDNLLPASLLLGNARIRRALSGARLLYGHALFNLHFGNTNFRSKLISKIRLFALRWGVSDKLLVNDPFALDWLANNHPQLVGKFRAFSDPLTGADLIAKPSARRALDLPAEGRIVGLLGALDTNPKKGVFEFVNALLRLKDDKRLLVLVAGRLSPETIDLFSPLKSLFGSRLLFINRWLSEKELHLATSACDVVCTPNTGNLGVSGIVMLALQANRNVVGSNLGWQGKVIPAFELGRVVDIKNPQLFANAIATVGAENDTPSAARESLLAYASTLNVGNTWLDAAGCFEPTEMITWHSVAETLI